MLIKNAKILSYGVEEGIYNILIENGKIKEVSKEEINTSDKDINTIIDAKNMYVTPGLIDAHTHLGVKADSLGLFYADHNEKKNIIAPELRIIDAIDPQMRTIKEARLAGITTCATGPGSLNIIGGQYAIIKTRGNVVEEMLINPYFAMKAALGENPKSGYETTRMGIASTLREFLKDCVRYEKSHDKYDKKMEAMIPVIKGEKTLKIHCHQANDIATAIRICEEFNLKYTLDHVTGGVDILDYLNTKPNLRLILGPSLGSRGKVELAGKSFENVVKLAKNRDVCLTTDAPVIPLQYLPVCAGLAISKGMPYNKALEAITINPARFLEIENRVGSIEKGKDADLVIWEHLPFVTIQDPKYVILDGKIMK